MTSRLERATENFPRVKLTFFIFFKTLFTKFKIIIIIIIITIVTIVVIIIIITNNNDNNNKRESTEHPK